MKPVATIIVGFIAGLAISGVLGDIIVAVNNSAGRISAAWSISKAEKYAAGGNFESASAEYEKALKKINPGNKKLLAKTKNNLAMCVFSIADANKDAAAIKKSIEIFSQSLALYKDAGDTESISQVETNLKEAEKALKQLIVNSE
ncbi:MAG: hypothetical protein FWC57_03460 [Endomicrobia bacterium]|nr:hypothetical protein [Endomicrobiia bacterium]